MCDLETSGFRMMEPCRRPRPGTGSDQSGTARVWPIWPDPADLIAHAKRIVPRCLTMLERQQLHLRPEVPAWCRELKKWPYDRAEEE
jgi:hypothetical protein